VPLTDKPSVLTQYQVDFLKANATLLGVPDTPNTASPTPSIFYGDQQLIPVTPTLCVEPNERPREMTHTGNKGSVSFNQYIYIYHGQLQDDQLNVKECNQFSEAVEALLHTDKTMGGNVIYGYVAQMQAGVLIRSPRTMMRATRLTWLGISQVVI